MVKIKSIILNRNGSFTIKMEGYSMTANSLQLEEIFNTCFETSIIDYLDKLR